METVRIRVLFEDRHVLSKTQRSEGLKRSWLLLNPEHLQTISDLSDYLLHHFNLHHSCPNGLLLSMEGFVLPPFESTCVLRDKEIICVKKKRDRQSDAIEAGDVTELLEGEVVAEKLPVHTVVPLLANEEFEKETGGYQSESEEDEEGQLEGTSCSEDSSGDNPVSKKRKASTKLQSPKKKKHRVVVPNVLENDGQTEQTENHDDDGPHPKKSNRKKVKECDVKSKSIISSSPGTVERSNKKVESSPTLKGSEQQQENGQEIDDVSVPNGTKKLPSRSARRKKVKRQWLREVAKISKKKPHWKTESAKDDEEVVGGHQKRLRHWKTESTKTEKNKQWNWKTDSVKADKNEVAGHPKGLLHWKQSREKHVHKNRAEHEERNQDGGLDTAIVPIVVRPGHIRFEPLENDQAAQQSEVSNETFQWNGITSKKKGQKWGTEKSSFARRNDTDDFKKENSKQWTAEKEVPVIGPIDFDKLPPLCGPPQDGDVIAYRLIELSSSWTPEISSFRVGQIFSYSSESSKIILMPVPEYPVVAEKGDEDTPDNAVYGEDGSLETDFSSLIDPRIVKQNNSDPAKVVSNGVNQVAHKDVKTSMVASGNQNKAHVSMPGKEVNLWDQLSETLNAKKAELSENEWTKASSRRDPWSYRALRGSALGPTMAMLRSKNKI